MLHKHPTSLATDNENTPKYVKGPYYVNKKHKGNSE